MDNRCQLRENVCISLGGIRVVAQGDFDHCQPNGPHIGRDGVRSDVIL